MAHFVGLDVSVKETSVCVVDDAGKVILEQKVPTEPAEQVLLTHGSKWSWLKACGAYGWPSGAGCVERPSRLPDAWLSFCTGCGSMVASSAGARTAPPFLGRLNQRRRTPENYRRR